MVILCSGSGDVKFDVRVECFNLGKDLLSFVSET